MTITLSTETENRLLAEAARTGVGVNQLAEQLIDAALSLTDAVPSNRASIEILNEWEAETATDDPAEIERREVEFDEFKNALNQTRIATDGPDARIVYP